MMNNRRGYTLIELVLVLFLLILIALSVFSLTGIGSRTYLRLTDKQTIAADLRIGISYFDVKLRQNDAAASIFVLDPPYAVDQINGKVLLIERLIDDRLYNLWIYQYDGYLCEILLEQGAVFLPEMGSRIVRIDRLEFDIVADDALRVSLSRSNEQGEMRQSERVITLRTGGVSQ